MRSAEGELSWRPGRDSERPYRSRLMDFLKGNTDVLDYLVLQMYTRGLSTRDVEDAFRDPMTGELLLGRTAISEMTDSLWEDYQRFCVRDLAGIEVEYVFLDAVYESLRRQGNLKKRCCAPGRFAEMGARSCCTWRWATKKAYLLA